VFLKKLSGAVDQLVDDKWWIDRDKIKKKLDNAPWNCKVSSGTSHNTSSIKLESAFTNKPTRLINGGSALTISRAVSTFSGAVDQLVDDKWWIDRDKIKKKLDNET
jgi:hypothetical protein